MLSHSSTLYCLYNVIFLVVFLFELAVHHCQLILYIPVLGICIYRYHYIYRNIDSVLLLQLLLSQRENSSNHLLHPCKMNTGGEVQ